MENLSMSYEFEGKAGKAYIYYICLVAAIGGFLFGFDIGLISGGILYLTPEFDLGPAMKGLVVASAALGCIAGPLFGIWLADSLGRKKGLIIAAICFLLSAVGTAIAPDCGQFIFWRMVGGIGVGLASAISPMYIAEISPARLRGRLVVLNQFAIVAGLFLSILTTYLLSGTPEFAVKDLNSFQHFSKTIQKEIDSNQPNPSKRLSELVSPEAMSVIINAGYKDNKDEVIDILNTVLKNKYFYQEDDFTGIPISAKAKRFIERGINDMPEEQVMTLNRLLFEAAYPEEISKSFIASGENWRWMFASEIIFIICFLVGLIFLPDSPRWLAMKNRAKESLSILTKVNGRIQADKELREIQAELIKESGTFKEILQPSIRVAVLIGIMIMSFQQVNGVNAILMYAPTIFIESGITSSSSAILRSVYLYTWIILCTVVAFWLTAQFPRRKILMYSVSGIALGHVFMALSFVYKINPVFTLLIVFWCSGCFTLGLAPLGWVILSEIYPNRIRGKAMSLACFVTFLCNFFDKQIFPISLDFFSKKFGTPAGTFLIYAVVCIVCVIFIWRLLPETKDKTLEEISGFWLKRSALNDNENPIKV